MDDQHRQPPDQPPEVPSQPYPGYSGPPPGAGYVPPPGPPGVPPSYPPHPYAAPYAPPPMPKRSGLPWWGWTLIGCAGLLVVGVIGCGIAGAVLGGGLFGMISRAANQQYVTATSSQTFTVSGAPTFVVTNPVGNVSYDVGTGNSISVQITKRAGDSSASAAQNALQMISATATQSGNTITIQSDPGDEHGFAQTREVDLVITGPAQATFNITDNTGDVTLDGVQGVITTDIQVGNLSLNNATLADGSRLQTNVGDITVEGQLAAGASVAVTASVGSVDLTLPASTSTHLSAHANTGSISISGWSVQTTSQGVGSTANGDLGGAPTGTLTVQVNTGSISIMAAS